VGIGTTAPSTLLEVNGTSWLRGGTAPTTGLFVDTNGNVGIGTTAPKTGLHILVSTGDSLIRVGSTQTSGASFRGIETYTDAGNDGALGWNRVGGLFELKTGTAATTKLAITTGGNVGIGTTAPELFWI